MLHRIALNGLNVLEESLFAFLCLVPYVSRAVGNRCVFVKENGEM